MSMRQPFAYTDHLDNTMRILVSIVAIVLCNFSPVYTVSDCADETSVISATIRNRQPCPEWLQWYCSLKS